MASNALVRWKYRCPKCGLPGPSYLIQVLRNFTWWKVFFRHSEPVQARGADGKLVTTFPPECIKEGTPAELDPLLQPISGDAA